MYIYKIEQSNTINLCRFCKPTPQLIPLCSLMWFHARYCSAPRTNLTPTISSLSDNATRISLCLYHLWLPDITRSGSFQAQQLVQPSQQVLLTDNISLSKRVEDGSKDLSCPTFIHLLYVMLKTPRKSTMGVGSIQANMSQGCLVLSALEIPLESH
jgi:hypothetical protein